MKTLNWYPKEIKNYLEKYYQNIDTRDTCRVYLKTFFTTINKEPRQYHKQKIDETRSDIWEFAKAIENRPKKTQATILSIIKKYLIRHDVEIKEREWEDIQIRNNLKRATAPITRKETPTANDLKKILSYANIKSKSLFTFCASTSLRIDEALEITFDDIDMKTRKVELLDEIAKFDIPRYTFFTPEAKELIELWRPEREKMLQIRYKKSKYLRSKLEKMGYTVKRVERAKSEGEPTYTWKIFKDDKELTKQDLTRLENRIWPFDYVNAQRMWSQLLEKAGDPYNKRDNNSKLQYPRYLYNIHSLRRFWFTQLSSDRANDEFVNFMGGHMSELDASYKKYDSSLMRQKMKEEYDNHMGCLFISEVQPDLKEVHEQLKEKDTEISDLRDEMQERKMEILELRLTLQELKNKKK